MKVQCKRCGLTRSCGRMDCWLDKMAEQVKRRAENLRDDMERALTDDLLPPDFLAENSIAIVERAYSNDYWIPVPLRIFITKQDQDEDGSPRYFAQCGLEGKSYTKVLFGLKETQIVRAVNDIRWIVAEKVQPDPVPPGYWEWAKRIPCEVAVRHRTEDAPSGTMAGAVVSEG